MSRFMRTEKESEARSAAPQGKDQDKEQKKEETVTAAAPPAQEQRPASRAAQSDEVSVISASLKVTGDLESDAALQVDGKVEGDVRGKVVTIGQGAEISGAIYGETVTIAGTVNGKIEARTVVVNKTARTTGEIIHDTLEIEAGAYVDGHCRPEFGKTNGKTASQKTVAQADSASAETRVAN